LPASRRRLDESGPDYQIVVKPTDPRTVLLIVEVSGSRGSAFGSLSFATSAGLVAAFTLSAEAAEVGESAEGNLGLSWFSGSSLGTSGEAFVELRFETAATLNDVVSDFVVGDEFGTALGGVVVFEGALDDEVLFVATPSQEDPRGAAVSSENTRSETREKHLFFAAKREPDLSPTAS
jgi:hypothetical protein